MITIQCSKRTDSPHIVTHAFLLGVILNMECGDGRLRRRQRSTGVRTIKSTLTLSAAVASHRRRCRHATHSRRSRFPGVRTPHTAHRNAITPKRRRPSLPCKRKRTSSTTKGPTIYKTLRRIIVADYFIIALFAAAHKHTHTHIHSVRRAALTACIQNSRWRRRCILSRRPGENNRTTNTNSEQRMQHHHCIASPRLLLYDDHKTIGDCGFCVCVLLLCVQHRRRR